MANTLDRGGSAEHMAGILRRSDHAEDQASTMGRGGGAEHMTSTLDRGGSAVHMAGILRRSDHAEDLASTLDRGGGAEDMTDMLRQSALAAPERIRSKNERLSAQSFTRRHPHMALRDGARHCNSALSLSFLLQILRET